MRNKINIFNYNKKDPNDCMPIASRCFSRKYTYLDYPGSLKSREQLKQIPNTLKQFIKYIKSSHTYSLCLYDTKIRILKA
jgi:hypothetical protein